MFFDCAQIGLFAAAMFAAGHSVIQRLCAAFFVTCAFILAWYAPGVPLARGVLAFLAIWSFGVVIKIAFSPEVVLPVHSRLLQVITQLFLLPGSLRAPRVPATLPVRGVGRIVLHLTLAGMALLVLLHTRQLVGPTPFTVRWVAGVVFFYAGVQFLFDFMRLCFLAMGLSLDSLHRTPIAACSLTDFWSQRWNRIASAWFHRFVFLPLARRRCPRLGVFCAFLVSGVYHGWFILVAIGVSGAFSTFLFFAVQGVFVLAEQRLHIHAWPVPIARGWTVAVLLASSPLFVDPCLRLFGL